MKQMPPTETPGTTSPSELSTEDLDFAASWFFAYRTYRRRETFFKELSPAEQDDYRLHVRIFLQLLATRRG